MRERQRVSAGRVLAEAGRAPQDGDGVVTGAASDGSVPGFDVRVTPAGTSEPMLTRAMAAELLRRFGLVEANVGLITRLADAGVLPYRFTAGGHRRFLAQDVLRCSGVARALLKAIAEAEHAGEVARQKRGAVASRGRP